VKISEQEFLQNHADTWAAKRAPEFSVVNVHMADIAAPRERIFPKLAARDLMLPSKGWRLLFGFRLWLGKIFGWDRGPEAHRAEPFEVGRHYGFFSIEHLEAPREAGMSVKNELTNALMSWVLEANGVGGARVYNVTCANFQGLRGRVYWRLIEIFHDGIVEDSLVLLAKRAARK